MHRANLNEICPVPHHPDLRSARPLFLARSVPPDLLPGPEQALFGEPPVCPGPVADRVLGEAVCRRAGAVEQPVGPILADLSQHRGHTANPGVHRFTVGARPGRRLIAGHHLWQPRALIASDLAQNSRPGRLTPLPVHFTSRHQTRATAPLLALKRPQPDDHTRLDRAAFCCRCSSATPTRHKRRLAEAPPAEPDARAASNGTDPARPGPVHACRTSLRCAHGRRADTVCQGMS